MKHFSQLLCHLFVGAHSDASSPNDSVIICCSVLVPASEIEIVCCCHMAIPRVRIRRTWTVQTGFDPIALSMRDHHRFPFIVEVNAIHHYSVEMHMLFLLDTASNQLLLLLYECMPSNNNNKNCEWWKRNRLTYWNSCHLLAIII